VKITFGKLKEHLLLSRSKCFKGLKRQKGDKNTYLYINNFVMNLFDYTLPKKISKGKDNKWYIRYTIQYTGKEKEYPKEYGRMLLGKSLNAIEDLKEREKEFNKAILLLEMKLKQGIDIRYPETVKAVIQEQLKESKKYSFDENFAFYFKMKKYDKPIPKKMISATNVRSFFKNQFQPFLIKKGLNDDITRVTNDDILEFMNGYYLSDNPETTWGNNTFNNKKGWLNAFFDCLLQEKRITLNPVAGIKNKSKESTGRFETYTKEERDIIFEYLDEKDVFIATVVRLIYYAYIRESELTRLRVDNFDLEKRRIAIHPDNAKGQKDKLYRWVIMTKQLQAALERYLEHFEHKPEWYMFGWKKKPSPTQLNNDWQYRFRMALAVLRDKHPTLFNRPGLSLYSMKHTGVTDFVNDNYKKNSKMNVLRYVQSQCRHEEISTTEIYLKKLQINIDIVDEFEFD
jgi:integrase